MWILTLIYPPEVRQRKSRKTTASRPNHEESSPTPGPKYQHCVSVTADEVAGQWLIRRGVSVSIMRNPCFPHKHEQWTRPRPLYSHAIFRECT